MLLSICFLMQRYNLLYHLPIDKIYSNIDSIYKTTNHIDYQHYINIKRNNYKECFLLHRYFLSYNFLTILLHYLYFEVLSPLLYHGYET